MNRQITPSKTLLAAWLSLCSTSACDTLWKGFTSPDPRSCASPMTELNCQAPQVCNPNSGQCEDGPGLLSLHPNMMPMSAGQPVEVTSSLLTKDTVVKIAGQALLPPLFAPASNQIKGIVAKSPGRCGPVDVELLRSDGSMFKGTGAFTYTFEPLTVKSPTTLLAGVGSISKILLANLDDDPGGNMDVLLRTATGPQAILNPVTNPTLPQALPIVANVDQHIAIARIAGKSRSTLVFGDTVADVTARSPVTILTWDETRLMYVPKSPGSVPGQIKHMLALDSNHDGTDEIVIISQPTAAQTNSTVTMMYNSNSTWYIYQNNSLLANNAVIAITTGDINNDKIEDLLMTTANQPGATALYALSWDGVHLDPIPTPASPQGMFTAVATGDWDAIVMTHSTFELLPMSAGFTGDFIKDTIREIEMAVRMCSADSRSNRIVKQLERMKKTWKIRLERLENQDRKDDFLCWEALGVDWLAYDEAHSAKNLFRHTKMARIAGLPLSNSQRAFDLYLKTRHTMSLYRGEHRGVVLATATPVANSMAEVHTFQRFLQPNTLRSLGLEQFDAWAATFGETVTALEIAPDGSGYRLNTRFARFINVPDLMTVFCDVSDIRTREMLKLPVPILKGDKPRTVTCKPSEPLRAFVRSLVKRAERLKTARVDPREDNMLMIASEGRLAALDMRLINSRQPADPGGKVAQCAREVHNIWQETASLKRAQLVFCDLSTPKSGMAFSVYQALREELIELGLPAEQIAFIHDAETDSQKARLFRQVREGKVRVLLGSTPKMGVGTNVQRRLVALHELDCPWRPCDVEQREGRILRQGNECAEVEIIRYVTEGSFDAYSWQTVLTKAKFIAQVMSGDKGIRSVEDVELATLTYAEVKALASGNPKIIEKAGVDAEIAKYASLLSVWRNQRYANESEVAGLPMRIESNERLLAALVADAERAHAVLGTDLVVNVHGRTHRGREEIGEVLRATVRSARASISRSARDEVIGTVGAFELCVFIGRAEDEVHLFVRGASSHECRPCQTGPALHAGLIETIREIAPHRDDCAQRLARMRSKLEGLAAELQRPFEHEDRLAALIARQRELEAELDLGKDEVGSNAVEDVPEQIAA